MRMRHRSEAGVDRWDGIGAAGGLLLGAALWGAWGWPAALGLWGLLLLVIYVVNEVL